MNIVSNSNNILSVLDNFALDNPDDIMMQVAENFRKRRVEKNITRQLGNALSGNIFLNSTLAEILRNPHHNIVRIIKRKVI